MLVCFWRDPIFMPVKIPGISRLCFGRIDRNCAHHCFFGHSFYRPPKRSAPVGYVGHNGLTTENIFSTQSSHCFTQLPRPFATAKLSKTGSSFVLYTRAPEDC